ncbi:MAG: hypothetical protein OXH83_19600 [Bryobacterales bacterium]|nr:hypothetical protein [Bryobacterales bacterium]
MTRKRYKSDEIVGNLRLADVLHGHGMAMGEGIRQLGINEVTFYRWRTNHTCGLSFRGRPQTTALPISGSSCMKATRPDSSVRI